MTPEYCKSVLRNIRENRKKLEGCRCHDFGILPIKKFYGNTKLECKKCSGEMTVPDIMRYREGYQAAGSNPDHILIIPKESE